MAIEKIIVALNEIDFDSLSDQELVQLSEVLKSTSSKATRVTYFRKRALSNHDPDVMATTD